MVCLVPKLLQVTENPLKWSICWRSSANDMGGLGITKVTLSHFNFPFYIYLCGPTGRRIMREALIKCGKGI